MPNAALALCKNTLGVSEKNDGGMERLLLYHGMEPWWGTRILIFPTFCYTVGRTIASQHCVHDCKLCAASCASHTIPHPEDDAVTYWSNRMRSHPPTHQASCISSIQP